jgi:predicted nucleic acid-binding protein
MKVVFDTNIFISAFVVRGSLGERAFLLAQQKRFDLCTSVSILTETARKLRGKFNQADEDITGALKLIRPSFQRFISRASESMSSQMLPTIAFWNVRSPPART